jgi:hypothetical protein
MIELIEPPVRSAPRAALRKPHGEYANAAANCCAGICVEQPSRNDEWQTRAMDASADAMKRARSRARHYAR